MLFTNEGDLDANDNHIDHYQATGSLPPYIGNFQDLSNGHTPRVNATHSATLDNESEAVPGEPVSGAAWSPGIEQAAFVNRFVDGVVTQQTGLPTSRRLSAQLAAATASPNPAQDGGDSSDFNIMQPTASDPGVQEAYVNRFVNEAVTEQNGLPAVCDTAMQSAPGIVGSAQHFTIPNTSRVMQFTGDNSNTNFTYVSPYSSPDAQTQPSGSPCLQQTAADFNAMLLSHGANPVPMSPYFGASNRDMASTGAQRSAYTGPFAGEIPAYLSAQGSQSGQVNLFPQAQQQQKQQKQHPQLRYKHTTPADYANVHDWQAARESVRPRGSPPFVPPGPAVSTSQPEQSMSQAQLSALMFNVSGPYAGGVPRQGRSIQSTYSHDEAPLPSFPPEPPIRFGLSFAQSLIDDPLPFTNAQGGKRKRKAPEPKFDVKKRGFRTLNPHGETRRQKVTDPRAWGMTNAQLLEQQPSWIQGEVLLRFLLEYDACELTKARKENSSNVIKARDRAIEDRAYSLDAEKADVVSKFELEKQEFRFKKRVNEIGEEKADVEREMYLQPSLKGGIVQGEPGLQRVNSSGLNKWMKMMSSKLGETEEQTRAGRPFAVRDMEEAKKKAAQFKADREKAATAIASGETVASEDGPAKKRIKRNNSTATNGGRKGKRTSTAAVPTSNSELIDLTTLQPDATTPAPASATSQTLTPEQPQQVPWAVQQGYVPAATCGYESFEDRAERERQQAEASAEIAAFEASILLEMGNHNIFHDEREQPQN
ncbi:hypothetical protein B9Z65_2036 [Elsinoe australis]|uniref:Uncharacterized protein n=1 Tax=Elsinoe australis TaxID=40998 RepID=A0A2P7YMV1_9PEZI|nr:hypothetical protein B9Z65_2036 [Elsinoe australis]